MLATPADSKPSQWSTAVIENDKLKEELNTVRNDLNTARMEVKAAKEEMQKYKNKMEQEHIALLEAP